jgi:hypothetical protein
MSKQASITPDESMPLTPDLRLSVTEKTSEASLTALALGGVIISLLTGVIGNLLFYEHPLGINIVFYLVVICVGALTLVIRFERPINPKNALLVIPVPVFGVLFSLTSSGTLWFFNTLIVGISMFLFLRFLSHQVWLGGSWRASILSAFYMGIIGWLDAPIFMLKLAPRWLLRTNLSEAQLTRITAVVRGILITLPVIILFGLLLGSADVVFGDYLTDTLDFFLPTDLETLIGQLLLVTFLTWLALMGYKMMLFTEPKLGGVFTIGSTPDAVASEAKQPTWQLGRIELAMLLGSINVLFLGFILVQAQYLFGGKANITEQGYTYAEYARRGFFEIVAVSVLVVGVVFLVRMTSPLSLKKHRWYKGVLLLMMVFTLVLLVAAFERLRLYVEAFGYTRLRLETQVFILALVIFFLVLIYETWQVETRWFFQVGLIIAIGYVLILNLLPEDHYIAEHNMRRFERTDKIDVFYLTQLSDDAIPAYVELLESTSLEESERYHLQAHLSYRLSQLDLMHEKNDRLGYHFGKQRAWRALDAHRDKIENNTPSS